MDLSTMHQSFSEIAESLTPTLTGCFLPTGYEALIVVEACLSGLLSFRMLSTGLIKSGDVYVFELDDPKAPLVDENRNWVAIDYDGTFDISQSDGDGLMKKEMRLTVDGRCVYLVSYYNLWHTVVGRLLPPLAKGIKDIRIRGELTRQKPRFSSPPMEKFRMKVQIIGPMRNNFLQNIILLCLVWTKESYYPQLRQIMEGNRFPIVHSKQEHWIMLSQTPEFIDKSPNELAYQTEALLDRLLWLPTRDNLFAVEHLEPFPGFTPLQNVCLYCQAFGILVKPLGAFQPLDTAKIESGLKGLRFLKFRAPSAENLILWNDFLQQYLPIDCPPDDQIVPECFRTMLAQMTTTDQEKVQMGVELLYEQFPSLSNPEYRSYVLLHQYHHCSSANVNELLRDWSQTPDGRCVRLWLLEAFQSPLQPLQLALMISDFLVLSALSGRGEEDSSPDLLPGLPGFTQYLSDSGIIEEDHSLLNSVLTSFVDALRTLKEHELIPAIAFLERGAVIGYGRDDELYAYFKLRLAGKSHQGALEDW